MKPIEPPRYVSGRGSVLRMLGAMAQGGGQYYANIDAEAKRAQRIKEAEAQQQRILAESRIYERELHNQRRAERKEDAAEARELNRESALQTRKDLDDYKQENPTHRGMIQAVGPDGLLRYYKQNSNGDVTATNIAPSSSVKKPNKGSQSKPRNATQLEVEGYLSRMENASELLNEVPYDGTGVQGLYDKLLTRSDGTNFMASSKGQQYKTLAAEWIRAKLRKESGAAIGKAEMAEEYRTYFPQPGDKDDVIKYKAKLRKHAEASLRIEAGIDSGMSKAATDYVQKYLN